MKIPRNMLRNNLLIVGLLVTSVTHAMEAPMIELQWFNNDNTPGGVIEIPLEAANHSVAIKDMLDDLAQAATPGIPIPIHHVSKETLEHVVECLKIIQHGGDIEGYVQKIADQGPALYALILAAQYLGINPLFDVCNRVWRKDANTLTDMVQALTKKVLEIRDKSVKINLDQDAQAVNEIVGEIKALAEELEAIKTFVNQAIEKNPDFKNTLNDEGMPPRIIEGELELSFRYDLDAIGRSLGLGTVEGNPDIKNLTAIENDIYNVLENLKGPLIIFNNLRKRYSGYKQFLSEEREGKYGEKNENGEYKYKYGKRYTPQEAHVVLHIAAYVIAIEQALELAKYDNGRHLCNLLKTYAEWLITFGTHLNPDVDIVSAHGSLMGTSDKNGKRMLDWTNELGEKLRNSNLSGPFIDDAQKQFNEIKTTLREGRFTNEETKKVEKIKTRDPLSSDNEKLNEYGFKAEKKPIPDIPDVGTKQTHEEKIRGLDLETEKAFLQYLHSNGQMSISDITKYWNTIKYLKKFWDVKATRKHLKKLWYTGFIYKVGTEENDPDKEYFAAVKGFSNAADLAQTSDLTKYTFPAWEKERHLNAKEKKLTQEKQKEEALKTQETNVPDATLDTTK